jgi:hypothetical protein
VLVKLPSTCECGCLIGRIEPTKGALCNQCNKARFPVSEETERFLERIAGMFGAPREIVFRTPAALEKIEQQDFQLKNRRARDGRSFYQIISDVFDRIEDGGDEAPDGSGSAETTGDDD